MNFESSSSPHPLPDTEDARLHYLEARDALRFSSAVPKDQASELRRGFSVMLRRKKLILLSTLISATIAAIYCVCTPPTYTARTTVELRGHEPLLATSPSETLLGADTRKIEYLKTTVAKLTLDGLADEILSQDGIGLALQRYWEGPTTPFMVALGSLFPLPDKTPAPMQRGTLDSHFLHDPAFIKRYLSLVQIVPIHETNLVYIQASTADPQLSQRLANTHAKQFIEHLKRERQEAISANVQLLQAQAVDLKNRVAQSENQLAAYASQYKLLTLRGDDTNSLNTRQIESLAQMVADATGRRIRAESALNEAKQKRETESAVSDSEVTRELRVSLNQAQTEYATLASQVTAEYPTMKELQAKIQSLRKSIQDERKRALVTLQSQFEAERTTELNLRQQIENERAKAQDIAKHLIQYSVLNKEATSLRELYQNVLKQAKEIEMRASTTTSNVFIADYAPLPSTPSAPKTNIIMTMFMLLGLAGGILAAYVRDSLEDTIETSNVAQEALDLPQLGSIPRFTETALLEQRNIDPESSQKRVLPATPPPENGASESALVPATSQLVSVSAPHSPIAEALRTLRANLLLSSADYPPRVVALASALPGEGKSTILANLSVTLAQANHRTLLIDGDLRLGGLSKLFHMTGTPIGAGLTDYLTGQAPLEGAIYSTSVPNLDIMPVGSMAPNPAELVGSASMKRLLSLLKDRYDFIMVDTPPIMAVADGLLLSRLVDSVIFVTRCGHTPRHTAREARAKLNRIRARVIGFVLNEVPPTSRRRGEIHYGANYLNA
jgi:capsular exopolysaccharide synthesis family protein